MICIKTPGATGITIPVNLKTMRPPQQYNLENVIQNVPEQSDGMKADWWHLSHFHLLHSAGTTPTSSTVSPPCVLSDSFSSLWLTCCVLCPPLCPGHTHSPVLSWPAILYCGPVLPWRPDASATSCAAFEPHLAPCLGPSASSLPPAVPITQLGETKIATIRSPVIEPALLPPFPTGRPACLLYAGATRSALQGPGYLCCQHPPQPPPDTLLWEKKSR